MSDSFHGPGGLEIPAVTEAEMREVDRVAIEETGPNLFQMMENAGRNLALTALDMAVASGDGGIVVLAGTGGNGGGGIAAARHLANRGLDVTVVLTHESGLGEVPASQLRTYRFTAGRIAGPADLATLKPSLIIDAVIGYSLRGAPTGMSATMIEWAQGQPGSLLSLDVPSGIDATTGEAPGVHVTADTTLTLALPKTGLVAEAAGELVLGDLGIPVETYRRAWIPIHESPFGNRFTIPLSRP